MKTAIRQLIDKIPDECVELKRQAEFLVREEMLQLEMAYHEGFRNGVTARFIPFEVYIKKYDCNDISKETEPD
jgi:hypothetical protein